MVGSLFVLMDKQPLLSILGQMNPFLFFTSMNAGGNWIGSYQVSLGAVLEGLHAEGPRDFPSILMRFQLPPILGSTLLSQKPYLSSSCRIETSRADPPAVLKIFEFAKH